mmetsp:Transcript_12751/g.20283  ORF Transcript_12751/g.20283 Transcript_12751/m.20283 type:complete len:302 (+) Transcript_12751:59-964(+)|eukprot:CAMPEP_0197022076 /NCGR_PEP_ID=MMETSP1384-20130603/2975_1 /TAXON_ID=29189 /ORGANISM="Ammonia sp." /LENGTH=301 /DNA_ID=CAMNT_0042450043 /DNA_START=57 /DNA_END=962 /DNA_ORIENTATION=+
MATFVVFVGIFSTAVYGTHVCPKYGSVPINETYFGDTTNNDTDNLGICFGSNTFWNNYPWTVALMGSNGFPMCTGTILSRNPGIILTAAHCYGPARSVNVGCSSPLSCGSANSISIEEFAIHPSFGRPKPNSYDIGMIRLSKAITNALAVVANLVDQIPNGPWPQRIASYGINQQGQIPASLQTMSTTVVDWQKCRNTILDVCGTDFLDDTMYCVQGGSRETGNPTVCDGDSGGGMMDTSRNVWGVASWTVKGSGFGCMDSCHCCTNLPQVMASVGAGYDWITQTMRNWGARYDQNITESA